MLWYGRFREFLRMGKDRSLLGCYNNERVTKGRKGSLHPAMSWRRNCDRWHWRARAAAYDLEQDRLTQEEWEARQAEWRQREWTMGSALYDKAEQMLKFPVTRITSEDGRVVMNPADWKPSDVARYADTGSKLARLAADMETESVKESGTLEIIVKHVEQDNNRGTAATPGTGAGQE